MYKQWKTFKHQSPRLECEERGSYSLSIMARKARIVHEPKQKIDFAPGIDNVVLRREGVEFYSIETFHSSPFYNRTVPLLIKDISESNDVVDIYSINGLRLKNDKVILINNHPIRKIKLVGRITEYFIKEIKKEEFYFLTIDDSSGVDIVAKVPRSNFLGAGLQLASCNYKALELTGYCHSYDNRYEFHADFIQLLSITDRYLEEEVQFWKEALHMRSILMVPWYQTPQVDDSEVPQVRLEARTYREKLIRQRLNLGPEDDFSSQAMVMDSQIYTKSLRNKDDYSGARISGSESDQESDIEEITKQVFTDSVYKGSKPIASSPKSTSSSGWIYIASIPIKKMRHETRLQFELMKWMRRNNRKEFNLNEPYKDDRITSVIDDIAKVKYSRFKSGEKSVNKIRGEIFHEERHSLQKWNLIRCTRAKECRCAPVLRFFKHLRVSLESVKFSSTHDRANTLDTEEYINLFNRDEDLDIKMDIDLLNILIQWYLLKVEDDDWQYNPQTKEWKYLSKRKRRKLVVRGARQ